MIYLMFTMAANWNSAYPYAVGPTFYGVKNAVKVTAISEPVTIYKSNNTGIESFIQEMNISIYPNPTSDLLAVQCNEINRENINVELYDFTGKLVQSCVLLQGSSIAYFDTQTLYAGQYVVKINTTSKVYTRNISIVK